MIRILPETNAMIQNSATAASLHLQRKHHRTARACEPGPNGLCCTRVSLQHMRTHNEIVMPCSHYEISCNILSRNSLQPRFNELELCARIQTNQTASPMGPGLDLSEPLRDAARRRPDSRLAICDQLPTVTEKLFRKETRTVCEIVSSCFASAIHGSSWHFALAFSRAAFRSEIRG